MPFKDLREFIEKVREVDHLKEIDGASCDLEIGAITEVTAANPEHPFLLFDNIPGFPAGMRVASNMVNTPRRIALLLGMPLDASKVDLLRFWKDKINGLKPISPVKVEKGQAPILTHVAMDDEVDITKFPAPIWHELDGGPYLGTGCIAYTRDPDSPWTNLGCYRVQVHDKKTVGLYMSPGRHGRIMRDKYWAKGESCPVVITFGHELALWVASAHAPPYGYSEYEWTGGVRGEPVEIVDAPYTGIPIPATAELAIEGEIPPPEEEVRKEGPFGEWPGYYAHGAKDEPVIRVKSMLWRDDPINVGAPPLKPVTPYSFGIPFGAAMVWDQLEKMAVPEVKGVWCYSSTPSGGSGLPFIVISIKQRYPGHAKQAAMCPLGGRSGAYYGKIIVVVDDDIDPTDINEVVWAMATRSDPETDVDIIKGCWTSLLDPRIPPEKVNANDLTNSRMIINACRPYHWMKDFAPVNCISPALKQKTLEKWGQILQDAGVPPQKIAPSLTQQQQQQGR
jgi:4-hydroxy-3-polyprenylbenzoate decarboxylase|tara:strand:+ start:8599 stop:10119 length:1521 start_codon:yes stop_codon:yes gene_type:complete